MAKKAETAAAVTDCFDEDAARYVTDFVSLLKASGTGRPIALMPWQVDAIEPFYGTMRYDETGALIRRYQYLYLEIPKKNGKSELAAALGLYHLTADGELNGEVYVCAADRDNASIIFDAAVYMVESNPALKKRLRLVLSQRTIYDPITGSKMKVISSEAYSKHGYKPSCVIFDELHSQRNRELWDIMTFGAGSARRQPVWIVLTTAGKDPERRSIGWEIHLRARGILDYRAGKRGKGITDYETWLPFIYGLPDDPEEVSKLDIYDEALWHRVNPGLGITVKLSAVREEAKAARASESAELLFRWLRLNQWVSDGTVGWLPVYLYDKTQWHGELSSLLGKTCYGGLDLSTTTDLTAFVLLFPPQDGVPKWTALFRAWMPDSDLDAREKRDYAPYGDWYRANFLTRCVGDTIDFDDVQRTILQAAEDYHLKTLGVDPYLSRMMT
ncbi:MAG: terminase large subunit, partial [Oscillospiraceae bacterium]